MRSTKTMTRILWLLEKCLNRKLLTSCVLSVSLVSTPAVLAGYNPPSAPSSPPPSSATSTGGIRSIAQTVQRVGCTEESQTALTALAPYKHIGQTVSTHPSFAWFVPDSESLPMEFNLYKHQSSGVPQLVYTTKLQSSPGIMTFSLPKDEPGLSVGQYYRWQVIVYCNSSRAVITSADMEVVGMPSTLETELSTTTDPVNRAGLYAEAGLWYNALGEALGTSEPTRTIDYALTLLNELAQAELPRESEDSSDRSEQLRKIIEIEQDCK